MGHAGCDAPCCLVQELPVLHLPFLALALVSATQVADSGLRRWVQLAPDDSVPVVVTGTGAPVVLVAGPIGGAWGFRRIAPALAEAGHRVIVIDPFDPAHAGAARERSLSLLAERWASVLEALEVHDATIVAHSLSSTIALRMAVRRPALVSSIISLEGGVTDRPGTRGLRSAAAAAPLTKLPGGRGLVQRRVESSLRERSSSTAWITDEVVASYARPIARDPGRVVRLLRQLGEAREPESIHARLRDIRSPVLLLVGDVRHTSSPPADELAVLRDSLASFAMDTIAGAGHFLHEEQPVAVVERVLRVTADRRTAHAGVPRTRERAAP